MIESSTSAGLKPVSQRRSQETLQRIVDAFAAALEETSFEALTVAEICRRAGCSVGTFYGRVESKEHLLGHLCERAYDQLGAVVEQLAQSEPYADCTLEEMLAAQSQALVALHAERRGVIRAIVVHARRHDELADATRSFNARMVASFAGGWRRRRSPRHAEVPAGTAELAAIMAAAFLREAVVFGRLWPSMDEVATQDISRALVRMLLGMFAPHLVANATP